MGNFPIRAYAAAMLTVGLWAMSYIWADRLLALDIPVEFFVPVRTFLAGALLWILNKVTGVPMRIQSRRDLFMFVFLALCMPFIYFVAETYGLEFTESPTITSLVIATNPILAMVSGMVVFKEKFGPLNIVGVFVTLAGLWLVSFTRSQTGPLFWVGVGILFIAVVAYGAMVPLGLAYRISDTLNGLMAIPNIIALLALSGVVVSETKKEFK